MQLLLQKARLAGRATSRSQHALRWGVALAMVALAVPVYALSGPENPPPGAAAPAEGTPARVADVLPLTIAAAVPLRISMR